MSRSSYTEIGGVELDSPPAIALRAARDDDLHDAVRDAVDAGARVVGLFSDRDPRDAMSRLSGDRRLQREIEGSARGLWDAVIDVVTPPRRRRRRRRWILAAALVAITAGVAYLVTRERGGGMGDASASSPQTDAGVAGASEAR